MEVKRERWQKAWRGTWLQEAVLEGARGINGEPRSKRNIVHFTGPVAAADATSVTTTSAISTVAVSPATSLTTTSAVLTVAAAPPHL